MRASQGAEVMPGRVNSAAAGHQRSVLISLLSSLLTGHNYRPYRLLPSVFSRGAGGSAASAGLGRRAGALGGSCAGRSAKVNCEGLPGLLRRKEMHFCLHWECRAAAERHGVWSEGGQWWGGGLGGLQLPLYLFGGAAVSPQRKQTATKTWTLGMLNRRGNHLRLLIKILLQCHRNQHLLP